MLGTNTCVFTASYSKALRARRLQLFLTGTTRGRTHSETLKHYYLTAILQAGQRQMCHV